MIPLTSQGNSRAGSNPALCHPITLNKNCAHVSTGKLSVGFKSRRSEINRVGTIKKEGEIINERVYTI